MMAEFVHTTVDILIEKHLDGWGLRIRIPGFADDSLPQRYIVKADAEAAAKSIIQSIALAATTRGGDVNSSRPPPLPC